MLYCIKPPLSFSVALSPSPLSLSLPSSFYFPSYTPSCSLSQYNSPSFLSPLPVVAELDCGV